MGKPKKVKSHPKTAKKTRDTTILKKLASRVSELEIRLRDLEIAIRGATVNTTVFSDTCSSFGEAYLVDPYTDTVSGDTSE